MGRLQYIGRYIVDGRPLGKGNFATVELATHSVTRSKVAIKIIDTKKIKEDYVRQNLHREARILAQVRHPNIIRLYETIRSSTLYCLVTEFAGGGQLLEFVREHKDGRLSEKTARAFVRQLVSALHHLHERGIVHRDLKMENIILDEKKKNLKIVDFGLSNTFRRDAMLQTHCGSPEYAAPELFVMGTKYGSEVDIWSLGINMYAMVVGKLPFTTPFSEPQRRQKLLQQIQYGITAVHENDMNHLSQECCSLLNQCIEPNPHLRIPILDIEIHPWITDNGKEAFYYYQPPPNDREARKKITDRMSELLKVPIDRIESNVHQYRCDDISAMYNLLMDEHLKCKGLWDIDHTAKKDYRRLLHGRDKNEKKNIQKSMEDDSERKMAPTPVMLTKPSLYDPDYRIRRKSSSSYSSSFRPNGNSKTATNAVSRTRPGTSQSPYMSLSSPNQRTDTPDDTVSTNQEPEEEKSQPSQPIRNTDTEKNKAEEMEDDGPKLSIINMESFLSDGFKVRKGGNASFPSSSQSSCGTPRTGSARSSHFEEVYKKYMLAEEAKAKEAEQQGEKMELLEEILKCDKQSDAEGQENDDIDVKDAGKTEAEDSGNDCRSEVNDATMNGDMNDDDTVNVTEDNTDENICVEAEVDDAGDEKNVADNDLKDGSSEYGSDSGKENRIVRWVQTTQETTFNCSMLASPEPDTPASPEPDTPRKLLQTPVSIYSRDMFPSRQSQKSAQSKCSSRSAPKPTPWKQQYNVTRTTTIPEPAVRESLKEKGQKQGRGFQGSMYSPRTDMRRLHAGRTPIRGEGVRQSVPEDNIRVDSSTPTNPSRPETPTVSAWQDHIQKTYRIPPNNAAHKRVSMVTIRKKDIPSKQDVKMEKYTGKSTDVPEKDSVKSKKENIPRERMKNNIHVRIYSMIKEEETRQKRQLVLLHQQENQRKQQQQKLIQQQDWHRQQQQILQRRMSQWERKHSPNQPIGRKSAIILPKRSLPSFSATRKDDSIYANRTKSAGVFQVVKRDKPVAVVTPRTVRVKPDHRLGRCISSAKTS